MMRVLCAVGVVVAFSAACDMTTPAEPFARRVASPQFSSTTLNIFVPPTNDNYGGVAPVLLGQLQPRKWAIVKAAGKITLSQSPAYAACDPDANNSGFGKSFGPLGVPITAALRVNVFRGSSQLGMVVDPDSSSTKTKIIYNPFPNAEDITVGRNGIDGKNSCAWWYSLSGTQTATLIDLPDPKVRALETFVSSGDSVTFVASFPDVPNNWMAFLIGDTLATPKGYSGYSTISSCYNKKSCKVRVSASGRMYIRLSNTTGGNVHYASDVVWVGKNPAARLTLTCSPSSVILGARPHCIAGTSPGGAAIQVLDWEVISLETGSITPVCGTHTECFPRILESTMVRVRAEVDGVEQAKSVPISVVTTTDPGDCTQAWQERGFRSQQECDRMHTVLDSMVAGATSEGCENNAVSARTRAEAGQIFLWEEWYSAAVQGEGRIYISYTAYPPYNDSDKLLAELLFHEEYHLTSGKDHLGVDPQQDYNDEVYQFGRNCASEVYGD